MVFLREVIGLFILMFGRLFDCGRCVGVGLEEFMFFVCFCREFCLNWSNV